MLSSSSESKAVPRFGSISSPSTYRPSYSGGTYRSIGIKRETPVPSSRWFSPNKETATKETAIVKKLPSKTSSSDVTGSSENKSIKNGQNSTSTSNNLLTRTKAKDQSSTIARPSITVAKVRIRDVGSSNSSYSTSKSRDPSPCEPTKDRYTSSSGYVSSSYSKLYPRVTNKLQVNSFRSRSTSPAVSYLNGSDVAGRYRQNVEPIKTDAKPLADESSTNEETSTADSISSSPNETSTEPSVEMVEVNVITRATSPNLCSTSTANFSRCRRAEIAKTIEKTVTRPKRMMIGEDKGVQSDRMDDSTKNSRFSATRSSTPWPSYVESKYNNIGYSRFSGSTSNGTSLSKYSSNGNKNEKDSIESSPEKNDEKIIFEKSSPEKSPEKSSSSSSSSSKSSRESSVSKSPSISRSNSIKSSTKTEKSKSKSPPIASPKSTSVSPTKQKVYSSKALPPQPPKLESPTKCISAASSTSSASSSKWANKDFRKSALNVGQTDRPRKARTSSSSTDNEDSKKMQQKAISNQMSMARSDRSPSASSETSYSSGGGGDGNGISNAAAADDMTKNFIKLKISPPPTVAASTALAISSEVMHSNSNDMTYESASTPNGTIQNQTKDSSSSSSSSTHINEPQCAKIDNTKPSIMNRVLGPVTKIFKTKSPPRPFGDSQNGSDHENVISTNDGIKQDTLIESVLNQTTTTNETKLICSNDYLADESSWINSTIGEQTTDTQFDKFQGDETINMKDQLKPIESDHQFPWWMNETENDDTIAEDITLNQSYNETKTQINSVGSVDQTTHSSLPWWMVDEVMNSEAREKFRVAHVRSGERAWWLDEDTEESVNDILEAAETENDTGSKFTFKIKRIESGEQAWWMCEQNEGSATVESNKQNVIDETDKEDSADIDFWATINESLEAKRLEEKRKREQNKYANSFQYDINANCIPLGDRASPEGLEDLNNCSKNRLSPYDNVSTAGVELNLKKLFISRHQNIDDVLGVPCHTLSPIRLHNENNSFEEILPSQVRIHDATPKTILIENDRYVLGYIA